MKHAVDLLHGHIQLRQDEYVAEQVGLARKDFIAERLLFCLGHGKNAENACRDVPD